MKMFSNNTKLATYVLILICFAPKLQAQRTTRDSTRSVQLWGLSTGGNVPMFDLASRYNPFASVTLEYTRKNREGWFVGASFDAMYGNSVADANEIFRGLMDADGNLIGVNGEFAYIQPGLSGGQVGLNLGKLISPRYNPNSGLVLCQSLGLVQNKIGLRDQRGNFPQLQSPFVEGYDRLHRGIYTATGVRYLHLDNQERINYAFNLSINFALSRSVRGFNIDTGSLDNALKFDAFISAGFTWFLPVYSKQESFYLVD